MAGSFFCRVESLNENHCRSVAQNTLWCQDSLGNVRCGWLCVELSLGFGLLCKNGDPGKVMCSSPSGSAPASPCTLTLALFHLSQTYVEPWPRLVLLVFLFVDGP